ncbi:MAG: DUF86 domain-containing protein [Thermodesulfobacteriota bacterium]
MKDKRYCIDYLEDILDAISKIHNFTIGLSEQEFLEDEKTAFAVIRALEIIGEASKKIPDNLKIKHHEIPWREMSGLRDKLIHGYFVVNLAIVWKTIKRDLPEVEESIRDIIETERDSHIERT